MGNWTPMRAVFGIDLRTLALFRILLGVYLLLNVISRAQDLASHYTDFGVMPRSVLMGLLADGSWSLHLFNGSATAQTVLFALAAFTAIGMIVGWHTRLMTVASWVLLLSIQNRNIFILSGEDNLALLLTFWATFLPLGARYSIDYGLTRKPGEVSTPHTYWSWATAALLLQGMSMYFFSALLKSDPIWMPSGQAVYYALNLDYMATSFAIWFRQFETIMQGLTYYVWVLELVGPILIFSPIFHRPLRAVLMLLFMTMHLGFWLFLEIGLFPFISIVMNLTFMPGWMWDGLEQRLARRNVADLTIWYDQDCGFCLKMCHILKVFLLLPKAQLKPAQSHPEIGKVLEVNNSWVVTIGERRALKWAAFVLLLEASPVFRVFARPFRLSWVNALGDGVYNQVAKHRSRLSQLTNVLLPWRERPLARPLSWIGSTLIILLFAFITVQNLSTLPKLGISLPNSFVQIRQALGLYQNWTMFAPYPELDSPRPIIEGELEDGTVVDVYRMTVGAPPRSWDTHAAKDYVNGRWRKFMANLEDESYRDGDKVLALNYARYLCRVWNQNRTDLAPLSTFSIYFEVKRTMPPGQAAEIRLNNVWHHDCFDTE